MSLVKGRRLNSESSPAETVERCLSEARDFVDIAAGSPPQAAYQAVQVAMSYLVTAHNELWQLYNTNAA